MTLARIAQRLHMGSAGHISGFEALFAVQQIGAPELKLSPTSTNTLMLSWPAPSTGFVLQQNAGIASGTWSNITVTPVVVGNRNEVVVGHPSGSGFYRLKK